MKRFMNFRLLGWFIFHLFHEDKLVEKVTSVYSIAFRNLCKTHAPSYCSMRPRYFHNNAYTYDYPDFDIEVFLNRKAINNVYWSDLIATLDTADDIRAFNTLTDDVITVSRYSPWGELSESLPRIQRLFHERHDRGEFEFPTQMIIDILAENVNFNMAQPTIFLL